MEIVKREPTSCSKGIVHCTECGTDRYTPVKPSIVLQLRIRNLHSKTDNLEEMKILKKKLEELGVDGTLYYYSIQKNRSCWEVIK